MAATDISPNVDNYYIGAGEFYFRPLVNDVLGAWRDMGNVPEFTFESTVETKEHKSSRVATRMVDLTVILSQTGEARIVLEEWTGPNLAMWLLGTQTGADAAAKIDIGTMTTIKGHLAFNNTTNIGPKWNLWFPSVSFRPSGSINPLDDDWGKIELIGSVAVVGARFGIASPSPIAEAELPAWGFV